MLANGFGYIVTETNSIYASVSGGSVVEFEGDEGSATIQLPFDFDFFGETKTSITISANLYLTFGTIPAGNASYENDCPLDDTSPNDLIAVFWDDGIRRTTAPTGQVIVATHGIAPDRVLAVEFQNWDFYYQVNPNTWALEDAATTQQVLLHENGDIEFHYGPRSEGANGGCGDRAGGCSATIGLENSTGTENVTVQCDAGGVVEGRSIYFTHPAPIDPITLWRASHFTPGEIASGLAADDADPDRDGVINLAEFAFTGDPRSGASMGSRAIWLADNGDGDLDPELTFTCAVRRGVVFSANPDNAQESGLIDGVIYTIEGSRTLIGAWDGVVDHIGAADTAPGWSGLPDLTGSDWQYHTFSVFNGLLDHGFVRTAIAAP